MKRSAQRTSIQVCALLGALIAGVSISAFPYGADVISKITGVRDFFVTLFFVALGMQIVVASVDTVGVGGLLSAVIMLSRVVTNFPTARAMRLGSRVGILSSFQLSQSSEFSLVILALGAGYKHITPELQSLVLTSMLLMSVLSTYLIHFNDRLARYRVPPGRRRRG